MKKVKSMSPESRLERQILVKMLFGSHLYGTNTQDSDMDYKGIFMPTLDDILLNQVPKSVNLSSNKTNVKNTPSDVDLEIYSLPYFMKLACMGETVALDMLHAPRSMWIETSDVWEDLVSRREHFYTKNLKAFVGYARRQAAKYGIKGSRLNDAKRVVEYLERLYPGTTLADSWELLPEGEHIHKSEPRPEHNNLRMYRVCGKLMQETARVEYAKDIVEKFYLAYGARAQAAAENKGIDWKAVSHAVRAAYQVRELLSEGTITFPRPEAGMLRRIKRGELDYTTIVAPVLDSLMDMVEFLSAESTLPMKVDQGYWNQWLIDTLKIKVLRSSITE